MNKTLPTNTIMRLILLGTILCFGINQAQARYGAGVRASRPLTPVQPVRPIQPVVPVVPVIPGFGYGYDGYYNNFDDNEQPETTTPATPSLPEGTVTTLPEGAAPVTVFGKTYFFANGVYYSAQTINGQKVFVPTNP